MADLSVVPMAASMAELRAACLAESSVGLRADHSADAKAVCWVASMAAGMAARTVVRRVAD